MKAVIFNLVLCILCVSVYSWTAIIPYKKVDLDHGGHCYTESYKLGALKNGEEKRIEELCAVAQCLGTKDISILGCGTVIAEPPCYVLPGDLSKPYPDCCFEIKCPKITEDDEKKPNSL